MYLGFAADIDRAGLLRGKQEASAPRVARMYRDPMALSRRLEPRTVHFYAAGPSGKRSADSGARIRTLRSVAGIGTADAFCRHHLHLLGRSSVFFKASEGKASSVYRLLCGSMGQRMGRKGDRRKGNMGMKFCLLWKILKRKLPPLEAVREFPFLGCRVIPTESGDDSS